MRVIKLGGSLLEMEGLVPAFCRWLAEQPAAVGLMIVGGGRLADWVRELDRRHGLGASAAHWMAIRTMGMNAELVHALLPESGFAKHVREVPHQDDGASLWILDPWSFLQEDERSLGKLPHSWSVTSDSIAARVAAAVGAEELVLLKSRLPTAPGTLASAAQEGYVDEFFPRAAAGLRVRSVDLTRGHFPQQALRAGP